MELVGWATPPRYDQSTHKLYWAREIKFGDATENTLDYNLRMPGRGGVLILNAVAPIGRVKDIEASTPEILAMVDFNNGRQYQDLNVKSDKVATHGLAALVAGGVAAKMGLFKGLLVALVAARKFIVPGFVAILGLAKKSPDMLRFMQQDLPACGLVPSACDGGKELHGTAPATHGRRGRPRDEAELPIHIPPRGNRMRSGSLFPTRSIRGGGGAPAAEQVASFEFGSVDESYSRRRHGSARNVGVVGIAVFAEADPGADRRRDADPFPGRWALPPLR